MIAEIVMLEGTTCVYRSNVDLYFYVVGSQIENEVGTTISGAYNSLSIFNGIYNAILADILCSPLCTYIVSM